MNRLDNNSGITFEGTAKILSIQLLKLAKLVLTRASRKRARALRQNVTTDLADILEVYVLLAAALEAFINEFCWERIDEAKASGTDTYWLSGLEEIVTQKTEVRLKWRLVPQLLWQKAFEEGKPPWQDFNVLIQLRNSLLHYKIEFLLPGKAPKYLGHIQHLLSPSSQKTTSPRTLTDAIEETETWLDRICNIKVGIWAYNTSVAMIRRFLKLADRRSRDNYTWLLQGSGIRRIPERS